MYNVTNLYGSEHVCTWNVTVRPGKTISIKFITMQIISHDSCAFSYVLVCANFELGEFYILGCTDAIVI